MWVHHRPSGTRTIQKPPLDDSRAFLPRATLRVMPYAIQALPSSRGEIGWDIIYRLRDAIRPWQNPKVGYIHGPIASLRLPSGGGCALRGGSPAPAPPRPTGSCVPLRRAVAVLGVTACGMCPARLSRLVSLVAAGLARWPVAGKPSPLARDSLL